MTLRLNGSTSGYVEIDAPAVAANNTLTLPSGGELVAATSGNINVTSINSLNYPTAGALSNRNKIINGAMEIDQRNAGASVTAASSLYNLDRYQTIVNPASKFTIQQNAGSVTPPAGFTHYLGITSSSAYTVASGEYQTLWQRIEGYNCADLAWGTVNARTVTLSFWARSSLTGTFGGAVQNNAVDRSYPFSYSISTANTWEYKTVVIPGDTSGTWLTTNGVGITLSFGLGVGSTFSGTAGTWAGANLLSATGATSVVGTNGATFYITGVQLEAGTVATPFERRSYGQELALCERYYEKSFPSGTVPNHNVGGNPFIPLCGSAGCGGNSYFSINFRQIKRIAPTFRTFDPGGSATYTTNAGRFYNACNPGFQTTFVAPNIYDTHVTGYAQGATDTSLAFWWFAEAEL